MMCQILSVGESSGLQAGHFSTWRLLLRSHGVLLDAVCGLALCCWNKEGLLWQMLLDHNSVQFNSIYTVANQNNIRRRLFCSVVNLCYLYFLDIPPFKKKKQKKKPSNVTDLLPINVLSWKCSSRCLFLVLLTYYFNLFVAPIPIWDMLLPSKSKWSNSFL